MRFLNTQALPPELWLKIMKLIRKRSLLSIALVDRYLSEIARSELFATCSYKAFDPEKYEDGEAQLAKEIREIGRFFALAFGPAGFVRTWNYTRYFLIHDDDPEEERELEIIRSSEDRLQDRFLHMLPAYNNLSTLTMTGLSLCGTVLGPISLLPNLSSLSLLDISSYGSMRQHILLNVEHFVLQVDAFANLEYEIATLQYNLSLNPQRLRSLTVKDDIDLASTVAEDVFEDGAEFPLLMSLELAAMRLDMKHIYRVLPLLPALKTLTIQDMYLIEDDDETDEIDDMHNRENTRLVNLPNVCPHLTSVSGPIGFVTRITPGRPVESVGIQYKVQSRYFGVISLLQALNQSTSMVASLRVDGTPPPLARAILSKLYMYLPRLRALEIGLNYGEHGRAPVLRSLTHEGPVPIRDPDNPHAISRDFRVNVKCRVLAEIAMGTTLLPPALEYLSFGLDDCYCLDCGAGWARYKAFKAEIRNNPRFQSLKAFEMDIPL